MTQKNVFDDPFDYAEMVESLFKKADKQEEMLIHAAIGICGEAIELFAAARLGSVENAKEELGDMAFYIQKMLTLIGLTGSTADLDRILPAREIIEKYLEEDDRFSATVERIVNRSGELLDLCKKVWVYEDKKKELELIACFVTVIGHVHDYLVENPFLGSPDDIREGNRQKLRKRYPQGVFTNKDAQERKDKV